MQQAPKLHSCLVKLRQTNITYSENSDSLHILHGVWPFYAWMKAYLKLRNGNELARTTSYSDECFACSLNFEVAGISQLIARRTHPTRVSSVHTCVSNTVYTISAHAHLGVYSSRNVNVSTREHTEASCPLSCTVFLFTGDAYRFKSLCNSVPLVVFLELPFEEKAGRVFEMSVRVVKRLHFCLK